MISSWSHLRTATLRYGVLPLGVALLVLVLRSFVFLPYRLATSAMSPSLQTRQWVLFSRTASPERGDIILFDSPLGGSGIARIVALPGDSLELRAGQVTIDGERQPYHFAGSTDYALRIPREQGVYPLSLTSLVAYRLALREEVGYRGTSTDSLLPTSEERHFWHSYLQQHPWHTFARDYYWVLCDSPRAGVDSRHFGLLPARAIRGVLLLSF